VALRPGGVTSARVEDAAPQPAGGGVAHETRAGGGRPRGKPTVDDDHPMIPALFAETRPAAVIIVPPEMLYGLMPGGLRDVRLT
jgi:hypothetical protein